MKEKLRAYADQVSGEIRAVIGKDLRLGNIWENDDEMKQYIIDAVTKKTENSHMQIIFE